MRRAPGGVPGGNRVYGELPVTKVTPTLPGSGRRAAPAGARVIAGPAPVTS